MLVSRTVLHILQPLKPSSSMCCDIRGADDSHIEETVVNVKEHIQQYGHHLRQPTKEFSRRLRVQGIGFMVEGLGSKV